MDYDYVSSIKHEELKNYLKQQGLKTTGRKVELAAHVFWAYENNVPLGRFGKQIDTTGVISVSCLFIYHTHMYTWVSYTFVLIMNNDNRF